MVMWTEGAVGRAQGGTVVAGQATDICTGRGGC